MTDLFYLYRWTLLAALLTAPALALVGAQILARGWATRALIVSQASSAGVLLGLSALSLLGISNSIFQYVGVVSAAVAVSALIGTLLVASDRRDRRNLHASDPAAPASLLALYAGLIAAGAVLTALSPHLESSMTAAFAGDLSTVSDLESRLNLALSFGILGWLWLRWSRLTEAAFVQSVLSSTRKQHAGLAFPFFSMLALAVSMQSMGLIFVLGTLFIPTATVGKSGSTLKRFRTELVVTAGLGTLLGFAVSLGSTILPTTPTVLALQALTGLTVRLIRSRQRSRFTFSSAAP